MLLLPDNWTFLANSLRPMLSLLFQKVRIIGRFIPVMTSTFSLFKKEKARFEEEPPKRSFNIRTPSPLSTCFIVSEMICLASKASILQFMETAAMPFIGPTKYSAVAINSFPMKEWAMITAPTTPKFLLKMQILFMTLTNFPCPIKFSLPLFYQYP